MEEPVWSLEDLPYDLAGEIFSHLQSPADLLHVAQASKSLFYIAIRLLYRNIHYETASQFFHNLPFWQSGIVLNVAEVPRSVVIGREMGQSLCLEPRTDTLPRPPRPLLSLPGVDAYDPDEESFPLTFTPLCELLLSFSKLEKLIFQQARILPEFHYFLGQLPETIRSLVFERCSFLSRSVLPTEIPINLKKLPVKELCLTGTHAGRLPGNFHIPNNVIINVQTLLASATTSTHDERPVFLDMYHILLRSPDIKSLCLDWNLACAGRFIRHPHLPTPAFARLNHLEVRFGVRNHAMWNAETNSAETKLFLMTAFARLLAPCDSLTELVLFGYIPGLGGNGSERPVLPALKSYTGPIDFLKSSLRRCEMLEKLIFPDTIKDIDAAMLRALPFNASESVHYLDITVEKWDSEVLYAVSMELPSLRVLKIKYELGYPDEDMLISFGPEFLSRLPNLTVFHLYRPDEEYDELRYLGIYSNLSKFANPSPYARASLKPKPSYNVPHRSGWNSVMANHLNVDTHIGSNLTLASAVSPNTASTSVDHTSDLGQNSTNNSAIGIASTNQSLSTNTAGPSLYSDVTQTHTGFSQTHTPNQFATFSQHDFVSHFLPGHRWRCTCRYRTSRALPKVPALDLGPCGLPDAHENMASWEKYATGLREVRLVDAFVWRRAGVGDEWCRRNLKETLVEEEEELQDHHCCKCSSARFMDDDEDEMFV
ncbi:hypothetical protein GGU10DRAFT_349448 [Lentinula aff. detonsa]|uniref:F-box domain-containing protein n=1 Tax=Lentinula aff. detonsa TaxID=2804958 RepID=A0AA38NML6_9AGAR|nr:hypothetical protein GGU10DRAFT_349448 [Lentinula aff. detonsa]